jgi:DDB1- and CUL4-associated factor 11
MSAAWQGGNGLSVIARHEWKGLSKMLNSLEDWDERRRLEAQEAESPRVAAHRYRTRFQARRRAMPGGLIDDGDDDNDE